MGMVVLTPPYLHGLFTILLMIAGVDAIIYVAEPFPLENYVPMRAERYLHWVLPLFGAGFSLYWLNQIDYWRGWLFCLIGCYLLLWFVLVDVVYLKYEPRSDFWSLLVCYLFAFNWLILIYLLVDRVWLQAVMVGGVGGVLLARFFWALAYSATDSWWYGGLGGWLLGQVGWFVGWLPWMAYGQGILLFVGFYLFTRWGYWHQQDNSQQMRYEMLGVILLLVGFLGITWWLSA